MMSVWPSFRSDARNITSVFYNDVLSAYLDVSFASLFCDIGDAGKEQCWQTGKKSMSVGLLLVDNYIVSYNV
jgi:hypothetical protein